MKIFLEYHERYSKCLKIMKTFTDISTTKLKYLTFILITFIDFIYFACNKQTL